MPDMSLFVPITKIDVEKRLVYGIATAEQEDRAGEIMDYESTKPHYEKWSSDIAKASGGKSLGNLRAMHGKIAAGKLTSINFDDAQKVIEVCAKVVDDAEWQKVEEGVYTGFSQGGAYVKRWKDESGLQRYTAAPSEISLVDLPCLPSATFEVIKASGIETRHFQTNEKEIAVTISNEAVAAKARELAKAAGDENAWAEHLETARAELEKAAEGGNEEAHDDAPTGGVEKSAEQVPSSVNDVEQVWLAKDGTPFKLKVDAIKHNDEIAKAAAGSPLANALKALDAAIKGEPVEKADKEPYGDVEYADPGYQDDKKKRYPLDTEKHIRAAWNYIHKDKNAAKYSAEQVKKIKAKIVAAWKDKIDADGPPEAAKKYAGPADLEKGLYTVSRLASLIEELGWLQESVEFEAAIEGDGSSLPANLMTAVSSLCDILRQMVIEETSEMTGGDDVEVETMEMSFSLPTEVADRLAKYAGADGLDAKSAAFLAKASEARSATGNEPENDALEKADGLAKVQAENKDLREQLEKAVGAITNTTEIINDLQKRLKAVEDQPMPGGPGRLNVVGKDGDAQTAEVPDVAKGLFDAMQSGDSERISTELLKISLSAGRRSLPGIGQVDPRQAPETE